MITYFSKMYQAVPALMQLYGELGGDFVSNRRSTLGAVRKLYPDTRTLKLTGALGILSAGERSLRKADLIVTGSPNQNFLKQYTAMKCMAFHGTYLYFSKTEADGLRHFDLICAIGPRMMETLEISGLGEKAIVSGYLPFMEYPAREQASRSSFLQQLQLNPEKKTIVYVPCGNPWGSWDLLADKLLAEIPTEFNLILRPHPSQSVAGRLKDRLGFMRLREACKRRGDTYLDIASCKTSTLYSVCDLVLSDGTSPPEESLYYDLPQVFVESPRLSRSIVRRMMEEKHTAPAYTERLLSLYDCGTVITPATPGLASIIQSAMDDAGKYQRQREEYFSWVFGKRGLELQHQSIGHLRQYAGRAS